MVSQNEVKPYLRKIRDWKIRNMVMLYLEASELFIECRRKLKKDVFISFDKLREICDILYEIKEDHHLIFKRLIDPQKSKFESADKFMPEEIEIAFMNNIGLLFHKIMVTRELKYVIEHYVEGSQEFQKNHDSLTAQLNQIAQLFREGEEILNSLLPLHKDNLLLLTLFLENPRTTKRHLGKDIHEIISQFSNGHPVEEMYRVVADFYARNGWKDKADKILKETLKRAPDHNGARKALKDLNENGHSSTRVRSAERQS